jgi:hypothetical protein
MVRSAAFGSCLKVISKVRRDFRFGRHAHESYASLASSLTCEFLQLAYKILTSKYCRSVGIGPIGPKAKFREDDVRTWLAESDKRNRIYLLDLCGFHRGLACWVSDDKEWLRRLGRNYPRHPRLDKPQATSGPPFSCSRAESRFRLTTASLHSRHRFPEKKVPPSNTVHKSYFFSGG